MTIVNRIAPWTCASPVVDAVVLAYVEWREESAAVWEAYDRWASAPTEDQLTASAAYGAALDREEAAAEAYEELIDLVQERSDTSAFSPLDHEVIE